MYLCIEASACDYSVVVFWPFQAEPENPIMEAHMSVYKLHLEKFPSSFDVDNPNV